MPPSPFPFPALFPSPTHSSHPPISGVQKKLSQASAVRRAIAAALMALSAAHCAARREVKGWSVAHARSQAHLAAASSPLAFARALASWLLAGVVAALLLPMHVLAGKLVYSKVKAAVNINKVGGGRWRTCVCACVHVCMCVCVHVCMRTRGASANQTIHFCS